MASRTKQKEEARARRLAEEQTRMERGRRQRRMRMLGGVLIAAIAIVAVAIAVSSSGGGGKAPASNSPKAKQAATTVDALLAGIPQSGNTLGNTSAKITVTEYGDLECSVCDEFALAPNVSTSAGVPGSGIEDQLISQEVRTGKVKLIYRSLETASSESPIANVFPIQQTAAYAAGLQGKAWNYIELFYNEQGQEGTGYVTSGYLDGLAKQIPGLKYASWLANSQSPTLQSQVQSDEQTAAAHGFNSTPTIVVQGPLGQASPIVGEPSSWAQLDSAIKSVS